jgi:hypothetical protein
MSRLIPFMALICGVSSALVLAGLSQAPSSAAKASGPAWWTYCTLSKTGQFDPIVFPGQTTAGHMHSFFGGDAQPTTTFETLRAGSSTCDQPTGMRHADKTTYWIPEAYQNGEVLPVETIIVYYSAGKVDPATVQPFKDGLRAIAGNAKATGPVPGVGWGCGGPNGPEPGNLITKYPRDCPNPDHPQVKAEIRFSSQCSNGELDSSDHYSHLVRPVEVEGSTYSRCPSTHPTPLPHLVLVARFLTSDGDGITLASGSTYTMHADYFDGWDKKNMKRLIARCMADGSGCGRL